MKKGHSVDCCSRDDEPSARATYVYCLVVGAATAVACARAARPCRAWGRSRLLDADRGIWLVVADAPLGRYGEDAINRGLSDLDWVSRAAIAHEAVVEVVHRRLGVVPMKLFTIFTSDDARARAHRARAAADRRGRSSASRTILNGASAWRSIARTCRRTGTTRANAPEPSTGAAFLARKKAQRDAAKQLAGRAHEVVADVYETLAAQARMAHAAIGGGAARAGRSVAARRSIPRARGHANSTVREARGEATRDAGARGLSGRCQRTMAPVQLHSGVTMARTRDRRVEQDRRRRPRPRRAGVDAARRHRSSAQQRCDGDRRRHARRRRHRSDLSAAVGAAVRRGSCAAGRTRASAAAAAASRRRSARSAMKRRRSPRKAALAHTAGVRPQNRRAAVAEAAER